MGFFTKIADTLTSTRRPGKGVEVLTKVEVLNKILKINRDTAPYKIEVCVKNGIDLVAEWKIVDAEWYGIFSKSSLKKVFKIQLRLDEEKKEVRALDREYSVAWTSGIPSLSLSAESFRGQKQEISFGSGYAFTENGEFGQVYNYKFSTKEIKSPIQDVVTSCGWTYKGVVLKKL